MEVPVTGAPERRGRPALAVAAGIVLVGATALLSRLPYAATASDEALLRLTWRLPALVIERCRERSAEEEAAVPAHMRTPRVCEGHGVGWRLAVEVDGRPAVHDTIHPAGVRGDRPLYVLDELPLAPGEHALDVVFAPLLPEGTEPDEELRDRTRPLRLSTRVDLAPREVVLVTWDPGTSRLVTARPVSR